MKFSIITPSLNQLPFLRQTARSILEQRGDFELEWIVIDGGSTDGTLEFLELLNDRRLRWISEKDKGQSDAINKGLKMARGESIGWLNSDDLYEEGSLEKVIGLFERNPEKSWLVGQCEIIDPENKIIRPGITRYKNRLLARYSYASLLRENCISQPAVFFRREFLDAVGYLDESLDYAMDYDLWLRMGRRHDPILTHQVLARFRIHSASKSGSQNRQRFDEDYRVACRYLQNNHWRRMIKRLNNEKIVWGYRVMRLAGK